MIPIGDDNSARKITPLVTYFLIVLNLIVFFLELNGGNAFVEKWAFIPTRFLNNPAAEWPTIFTSMFMHAGWLHLIGNMLYLWIFGDNVEDRFGHAKFLIFYLLCGIAAIFAQLFFSADSSIPNVGASGAISGVLGAYLLLYPQGRIRVFMGRGIMHAPALMVIGLWILLQVFSGIGSLQTTGQQGGVAYMAHIGGFVAGLGLTFLFRGRGGRSIEHRT